MVVRRHQSPPLHTLRASCLLRPPHTNVNIQTFTQQVRMVSLYFIAFLGFCANLIRLYTNDDSPDLSSFPDYFPLTMVLCEFTEEFNDPPTDAEVNFL
jgi:hypothetical protein